jgi:hypothetical protein
VCATVVQVTLFEFVYLRKTPLNFSGFYFGVMVNESHVEAIAHDASTTHSPKKFAGTRGGWKFGSRKKQLQSLITVIISILNLLFMSIKKDGRFYCPQDAFEELQSQRFWSHDHSNINTNITTVVRNVFQQKSGGSALLL